MKPLNEPLETFRLLLKEAESQIDAPIEIILIGGVAALLSGAIKRVTEDIDILASGEIVRTQGKSTERISIRKKTCLSPRGDRKKLLWTLIAKPRPSCLRAASPMFPYLPPISLDILKNRDKSRVVSGLSDRPLCRFAAHGRKFILQKTPLPGLHNGVLLWSLRIDHLHCLFKSAM